MPVKQRRITSDKQMSKRNPRYIQARCQKYDEGNLLIT